MSVENLRHVLACKVVKTFSLIVAAYIVNNIVMLIPTL